MSILEVQQLIEAKEAQYSQLYFEISELKQQLHYLQSAFQLKVLLQKFEDPKSLIELLHKYPAQSRMGEDSTVLYFKIMMPKDRLLTREDQETYETSSQKFFLSLKDHISTFHLRKHYYSGFVWFSKEELGILETYHIRFYKLQKQTLPYYQHLSMKFEDIGPILALFRKYPQLPEERFETGFSDCTTVMLPTMMSKDPVIKKIIQRGWDTLFDAYGTDGITFKGRISFTQEDELVIHTYHLKVMRKTGIQRCRGH